MYDLQLQLLPGRHYLAWITGGFLIGIFYGIYGLMPTKLPFSDFLCYSAAFFGIALLLLCLALLLITRYKPKISRRDLCLIVLVGLFFVLGICRVYCYDLLQNRGLKETAGRTCCYTGVLLDTPETSSSGRSFGAAVRITQAEQDGVSRAVSGTIMLYIKAESYYELHRGDTITFSAALSAPKGATFPGGFSYRQYLYRQGICFSAYVESVSGAETPTEIHTLSYRAATLGRTIQNSLFAAIDQSFGNRTEEAALLKGITLGNRESFTDAQYEHFALSSFTHITATSGMHVMFLFGFLSFLLRKLRLPRWLVRLLAMPILLIFAAGAAFTPSICRAVIMMLLLLLANQLRRESDSLTSLSFAALLLAVFNPYIITGYSFLLSFGATLGIIVFSAPLTQFLKRFSRAKSKKPGPPKRLLHWLSAQIKTSILLSISCTIGIGYLLARFFNRFSWGALLGNVPIVPLASYSFVGGLLLWGMYALHPPLAALFAQNLLWIPLWLMNRLAAFFSHPVFRFYLPTPPLSAFLPYLAVGAGLYLLLTRKQG